MRRHYSHSQFESEEREDAVVDSGLVGHYRIASGVEAFVVYECPLRSRRRHAHLQRWWTLLGHLQIPAQR